MSQPHRARTHSWISFLVTGPEDKLAEFDAPVEFFDRRGQTIRCRAHDFCGDNGDRNYKLAVEAAKKADVTLQDLVVSGKKNSRTHMLGGGATCTVSDCVEEYPVVHMGSDKMKWGRTE